MIKNVEVEIDVEIEDVIKFIGHASLTELDEIRDIVKEDDFEIDETGDFFAKVDNLYDREKFLILKTAYEKYNLEELIKIFGIRQGDDI